LRGKIEHSTIHTIEIGNCQHSRHSLCTDSFIQLHSLLVINLQTAHLKPSKPKSLGPIVAAYRGQPLTWRGLLTLIIPGSLMVLGLFLYGLWRARYAATHYGPAAAQTWGLGWYGLSAGALPLIGLLIFLRIRSSRRGVIVFKNGLGIQKTRKVKYVLPWGEISGITSEAVENRFLGIVFRNQTRLTIHPSIGKPIKIHHSLPKQDELSVRIKARLYPRLLPELRSYFKTGGNLYFGQVVINKQGIQLWGKKIPWDQVTHINVCEGFLVVELKNQMVRKISIGQIPNIELLLQIIQEGVDA
jgi:hypothetical protein